MNIQIETSFSEAQKIEILSRNEQIPNRFILFHVSNKFLDMLPKLNGTFIVSNESVQINTDVKYLPSMVSDAVAKGKLKAGDNIDMVMNQIKDLVERDKLASAQKKLKEQREAAQREIKDIAKQAEYERNAPVREWKRYNESAIEARENRAKAEKRAENQANEEKIAAEKAAWLNEFGSDRLKEGIRQGYECNRLYAAEKGAHKLGGAYILDYKYEISTGARLCPSMDALDEVNLLKEKEIDAGIVWLPYGFTEIKDDSEFPIEAVEVQIPGIQGHWYKEI